MKGLGLLKPHIIGLETGTRSYANSHVRPIAFDLGKGRLSVLSGRLSRAQRLLFHVPQPSIEPLCLVETVGKTKIG